MARLIGIKDDDEEVTLIIFRGIKGCYSKLLLFREMENKNPKEKFFSPINAKALARIE